MNRDEKRTRVAALPPLIVRLNGHRAILPREPQGGTWIAVNEAGLCLALINWHTIKREPAGQIVSRGQIVETLAGHVSAQEISASLQALPLRQLRPFRLLAFDLRKGSVVEWRWNLARIVRRTHRWKIQHWYSSGYDEPEAERQRAELCAVWPKSLGTANGLRQLHASHLRQRGPFSICMHRQDAATVSYTEVTVSRLRATMRYAQGPPCGHAIPVTRSIALRNGL